MPKNNNLWFIRRGNELQGPFASGLVKRYILLGRLRLSDQASADRLSWQPLSDIPDLHPSEMGLDLNDKSMRERFFAAIRWADERLGPDRRDGIIPSAEILERRKGDRRSSELPDSIRYRDSKLKRLQANREKNAASRKIAVSLLLIIAAIGALAFYFMPSVQQETMNDCTVPARSGVDWGNCSMEGKNISGKELKAANMSNINLTAANLQATRLLHADLSFASLNRADLQGANLQYATLKGADLRGANLTNADLTGADLSYSDLTNAILNGANLAGSKLDKAIWIDKTICRVGSISKCEQ